MRILRHIWWLPLAIYMIVMPSFVSDRLGSQNCSRIEIVIRDSSYYRFVTRESIFSLVHNDQQVTLGKPVSEIDIEKIESNIRKVKELESVEVYTSANGVLHVEANQRDPVVRIITTYGNSYYLDRGGNIIPHNGKYTPRVPVISGSVSVPDISIEEGSISNLTDDSLLKKLLAIIIRMREDDLWSGQVEQLFVLGNGDIEMIPRVGNHLIILGQPDGMDTKLRNLEALYRQAMPGVGWNVYSEIDLKYEGQIVCKKR